MSYRRLAIFASTALLGAVFAASSILAQEGPLAPRGMDALAARATFHTDMTFDQSMLQAASQIMPDEDRPIIAKLRSISVHTFRYSAPGLYDAASLDAVRAQYRDEGWTHLVTKQTHPPAQAVPSATTDASGMAVAPPKPFDPTQTDVWVRMDHTNFNGAVVLVANQRNVNLIVIDGMISPVDLLHLRGHFGIPKFSGDPQNSQ
ncbi:MAG TPA: hypothetical protein VHZ25_06345 [Acidobacteriaceae bacterium]|nr:hypothetical protein [Acidobacteriaceae bacterium]